MAGPAAGIWPLDHLLQPFCTVVKSRGVRPHSGRRYDRLRRQYADDRQHLGARASACRELKKSRCMGRSRGGQTTKVHALVAANGLPLELVLTPGQTRRAAAWGPARRHDCLGRQSTTPTGYVGRSRPPVPRPTSRGWCTAAGNPASARCSIGRANASNGSSIASSTSGRLATRCEKHAANFLAMLKLAAAQLWLRHNESVT